MVLLLRFVSTCEVDMHGSPLPIGEILAAAVPDVGIHHDDIASLPGHEDFAVGLLSRLRSATPLVRARHNTQRSIRFRKVVQHPN